MHISWLSVILFLVQVVTQLFLDHVYKLHENSHAIISDRGMVFISKFWQQFFRLQGIDLHYSIVYHPQTKDVNRCLEGYPWCMASDLPYTWFQWLPLPEFWYNTNHQFNINMSPFEMLYEYLPPFYIPYFPKDSLMAKVDIMLQTREATIQVLKHNLRKTQHRMKMLVDLKMTEHKFQIGDLVYIKLQPYQELKMHQGNQKFQSKYFSLPSYKGHR